MSSKPRPETDVLEMLVYDTGAKIKRWTDYAFNSHFLTPTDGFSLVVAGDDPSFERDLVPGHRIQLKLDNRVQAEGFIDSVSRSASRAGGVEWHIEGRDLLSHMVDSCQDPRVHIKEGQSLLAFLKAVFAPFGFSSDDDFEITNDANRSVLSGQAKGDKLSKKGRPLKSVVLHQLQPYSGEGAFSFASRVCQRFGLWLWLSADGRKIVVSRPDFRQAPLYGIQRKRDGTGNALDGTVRYDASDQPSCILAETTVGSPAFGRSRVRAFAANPTNAYGEDGNLLPDVAAIRDGWKGALVIDLPRYPRMYSAKQARAIYLTDHESHTIGQLANFVRREMALRVQKSLTARYTVVGHSQGEHGWAVDTIVRVDDEIGGLQEDMWVLARTFRRSRGGGTTTELELIRLGALYFGETGDDQP